MLAHSTDRGYGGTEHLTLREAADWLRETEQSTRRRVARGELRAYRIGTKRIVLKRADVVALLQPIRALAGAER